MSLELLRLQQENERLHTALSDAIAYLRLMPIAPVTQAKIRDLTNALESTAACVEAIGNGPPWELLKFTPAGLRLALSLHNGALHFSTQVSLPKDAQVDWRMDKANLDALIEALIAERREVR